MLTNKKMIARLTSPAIGCSRNEAYRRLGELRCIQLGLRRRDVLAYARNVDQLN